MPSSYTPDLTQVPTRTIPAAAAGGNIGIGPTKSNGETTVDYDTELDAHEENYLRDRCIFDATHIGVMESTETKDSRRTGFPTVRQMLNPDRRIVWEPFTDVVARNPRFATSATAPTLVNSTRGGYSFVLDPVATCDLIGGAFYATAQQPYFRCRFTLTGDPNTEFLFRFDDLATANEGWGVKLLTADKKINGFTRTGGVDTETTVDNWVTDTEHLLEFAVSSGTLYVAVDGGTFKGCGNPPSVSAVQLRMQALAGGAAGKVCILRAGMISANWTP